MENPSLVLKSCLKLGILGGCLGLATGTTSADTLFDPYSATPTGSWPEAVAIGDLNGDGLADVALVTSYYFDPQNDYKLFVFYQDQNGVLQSPLKYPTRATYTARPKSVDVGDLNGDGLDDVAVGLNGTGLEVFLQSENGQLLPSVFYPMTQSEVVRIGDLNNDHRQDVAGIGWGGSDAVVMYQNSDGSLAAPVSYYAPHGGYDDLALGDLTHDGLTDIVVMSGQGYANDNLAVLAQNVSGGFDPVQYYDLGDNELTNGVAIGDINGDTWKDIIVSYGGNRPSSNIAFFAQNQFGTFDNPVSLGSYDIPEPVVAADVNRDGNDDVLVLHGGWNRMGVYLQQPDGSLGPESLYPIPYASHYNPQGFAIGDINNDGSPDAVIADSNNGLVVLKNAHANVNPVANAGDDLNVLQRSWVTLDGTASNDPDGSIVSWSWSQISGPQVTLNDADGPSPSFWVRRFRGSTPKIFVFELTVFDNQGLSAKDQVTVTAFKKR